MSVRVKGRVRNVEIGSKHLYIFEMVGPKVRFEGLKIISEEGGVKIRKRFSKETEFVPFSKLAERNQAWRRVNGRDVLFTFTETGLLINVKGDRGTREIPFEQLHNFGRNQPLLIEKK